MSTTSTSHADEPRKLTRIWRTFRKHLTKILLLIMLCMAGMAAYVEFRTREYIAYAEVLIEQNELDLSGLSEDNSGNPAPMGPDEIEIELRRIGSAPILQKVIDELGLTFEEREAFGVMAWARAMLSTSLQGVASNDVASNDNRRELAHQLDVFRENFVIERDPLAFVVSIGYRATEPEAAADVANAVARTYLQNRMAIQRQAIGKAVHDLQRLADEISNSILAAEQKMEKYRAEVGLYAIDGVSPVEQRYVRLSRELTEATLDWTNARVLLQQAENGLADDVPAGGINEAQTSSLIGRLSGAKTEPDRRVPESGNATRNDPAVAASAAAEFSGVQNVVPAKGNRFVEQRRVKARAAETRFKELEKQVQRVRDELSSSQDSRLRLRELERNADTLKQSHQAMHQRLQRAREQEKLLTDSARIIGPATIPTKPSNVSGIVLMAMTFAGSCVAGLGWAFLIETRRLGFNDALEVETELGQPVLAMLPKVNGVAPIVTDQQASSRERQWSLEAYGFLEGVRSILNTLVPTGRDDGRPAGKVVLITSCFPDEGKTTLALSLTRQAAFGGAKSVLIEGDMRKTGLITKLRTVSPEKGLVDLLRGTVARVDDALVSEPESGADLLLAAGPCEDAFALSRSPHMKGVIDALRPRYDLIVIDCPPVLGVSDTRAMSEMADEILFVLRWQETHQIAARSAIRELERGKVPIAGVVLTQIDLARHLKYSTVDKFRYQDAYQ